MKTSKHLISKTANGIVYRCDSCNKYHIEYKNFIFNLSITEYDAFTKYVISLNNEVSNSKNYLGKFVRNITVPTKSDSLQILLNNEELNEIAWLFMINSKDSYNYDMTFKICYDFSLS